MAKKTRIKSGKGEVIISETGMDLLKILDIVIPEATKAITSRLEEIRDKAVEEWPVRKPEIRKDESGKIIFFKKKTQKSYQEFKIVAKVDPKKDKFVISLQNNARYAWAIKFGYDSVNYRGDPILKPRGKRVVTELLVRPMRKHIKELADTLHRDVKRRL